MRHRNETDETIAHTIYKNVLRGLVGLPAIYIIMRWLGIFAIVSNLWRWF